MRLTRAEQEQLEKLRDVVFPGQMTIDDEPAGEDDGPHQPAPVVSKTIADGKTSNSNCNDTPIDL